MRTYTEAQYSTFAAQEMIRGWLDGDHGEDRVEAVARYMARTLRVGGLKVCRELVRAAIRGG